VADQPAFITERLGDQHDRAAFSCGVEELDRYLKTQASQDVRRRVAAVHVMCLPDSPVVIGYYTLSSLTIEPKDLPPQIQKKMPRYPALPAFLIGRLARDLNAPGRGVGGHLLVSALQHCLRLSDEVGAVAVVVDAKNENARQFYGHFEFRPLPDRPNRLLLPMKTIEASFAE
jgi:GNAT superfamily N-acetyltransferase